MAPCNTASHEKRFLKVEYSLTRRKFLTTTSVSGAAIAEAGNIAAFAQDKPTIGVGSHNFTEQIILGEMLTQLPENSGYSANQHVNLGEAFMSQESMMDGDIETYVEYTGSGLIAILGLVIFPLAEMQKA